MSVKMYNEDYINETAKAIQKLTGRTEKMKVSEFADVINTYMEPDDLTNVHKVRITINSWVRTMDSSSYSSGQKGTIDAIKFIKSDTGEVYQYNSLDVLTANPEAEDNTDEYYSDLLNSTEIGVGYEVRWLTINGPIAITISFSNAIDLTQYNMLRVFSSAEILSESSGSPGPMAPSNITIDVQSGSSDYFTRLVNGKNVSNEYNSVELPSTDYVKFDIMFSIHKMYEWDFTSSETPLVDKIDGQTMTPMGSYTINSSGLYLSSLWNSSVRSTITGAVGRSIEWEFGNTTYQTRTNNPSMAATFGPQGFNSYGIAYFSNIGKWGFGNHGNNTPAVSFDGFTSPTAITNGKLKMRIISNDSISCYINDKFVGVVTSTRFGGVIGFGSAENNSYSPIVIKRCTIFN